ncbi:T9SS C-terminal target domain-containing protein [Paraflavitalea soli]|uniref:T9SS C-terminal target domain-containing protein n=1 Tax=Paraflavitalea soli TaxID=2315862 RepID=A0A3B7MGE0_9BACT|nr:cellulase family glycosylhydrolase [Paraflavitalea soli]AXY73422.1 T9SS C-terminal target domain-containing protein [Paraflavitalea soli]
MKKSIYRFLQVVSLVWLSLLMAPHSRAQTPVAKNGQLKVIGLKLCNQYGNPIQLRGMSTHGLQWYGWGSCLTEASLDALANDWGSDILRISLYVQEGGYDTDPAGYTAQVSRLIDEATERGMYALVDWHQLDPGDPNVNLAKAKTFFTAIANAHKDKVNIIYDVCNEPNGVTWARIKTYADQIIPVIRAIDADAPILVGTHGWGSFGISDGRSAQDIVSNPLTFSNIMYTFHFYAASHGQEYLDELDWGSDRLPVFVTEFGTQTASGDGTNNFTRSQQYLDLMRTKKISWTNWNYSDDFRSGAVWKTGTCPAGPWTVANLKPAGVWIRERMLSPADDFPGGVVTPTCDPVIASGDDGNVPANVLDNNLSTRWSASGNGQWIQFCLSDTVSVTGVQIAFYSGNTRTSSFDVLVGNDGVNWTTASAGRVSSGTSLNLETFTFTPRDAKYVRIVGHGNSVNLWNSYTEVKIQTGSTGGGQQLTLAPQHDAYVRNGTYAAVTHGTTDPAILISKLNSNPATGNDRHTYLRFDASGATGTVTSAILRVYGKLDDNRNSNIPVNVHAVSNTTWTESTITWNNKPATGASLGSATVTDSIGRYYTWDITAYVQAEKAAGRNTISLALLSTIATNPRITWNSKETGSNGPQLVVTTTQALNAGIVQNGKAGEDEVAGKVTLLSFPNPFKESNTIQFTLQKAGFANLSVYDMTGKQVAVLVNGNLPAGQHRAVFKPAGTAPGIYTIRLMYDRKVVTQKLVRE